jgi:lysophospholipase L1-like esterase
MKWVWIIALAFLAACGRGVPETARIVVAGDSVMAWNRIAGAAVADRLSARLGQPVGDVSLSFAQITGGQGPLNIPRQLAGLRPDLVVLNGGANDLSAGCDCSDCGPVLDRLITRDATVGAIPALVSDLRGRGAEVIWADYYTSPRYAGTICEAPYKELEARLTRLAATDSGMTLVDMDNVFSPGDLSLFAPDRTHPSQKGSARMADEIARVLGR